MLSRATKAGGVAAGATRPDQPAAAKPGATVSATVGTSGSSFERWAEVMASTRARPPFTWPSAAARESIISGTFPAGRSAMAGPLPRYGTCCALPGPALA